MSTFSSFGFIGLIAIPVLICQWIGVIGLRKSGRKAEWLLMLIGVIMTTLGMLAQFGYFLSYWFTSSFRSEWSMGMMIMIGALSALGSLSFAIGFALHGNRNSRITQRTTELEMMNLAQATELERLRNR